MISHLQPVRITDVLHQRHLTMASRHRIKFDLFQQQKIEEQKSKWTLFANNAHKWQAVYVYVHFGRHCSWRLCFDVRFKYEWREYKSTPMTGVNEE